MKTADEDITAKPKGCEVINCLWMDAGVVGYKLCDRAYDCEICPFDEVLHGYPTKRSRVALQEHIQLSSSCVLGCEIASDLFYDDGHTWSRVEEGGIFRLGVDDFGQRLLGVAYSLSLPRPGTDITRGDTFCRFTHQAGVAALCSPISGKVKATNPDLATRPTLINQDPYGKGWLMLVEPTDLQSCLKRSLYGERVAPWLLREIETLRLRLSATSSDGQNTPTLADGGVISKQFLHGLDVEQTRRVISSFFPVSSNDETEPKSAILISNRRSTSW